jgi:hypothetical protein
MKAFWSAMLAMVVIAVISSFVLEQFAMPSSEVNTAQNVRVD